MEHLSIGFSDCLGGPLVAPPPSILDHDQSMSSEQIIARFNNPKIDSKLEKTGWVAWLVCRWPSAYNVAPPRSNLTPSQLVGIHQHRNWSSLDDRWSSVCSETLSAEACQVGEEVLVHMDDFFYQEPFQRVPVWPTPAQAYNRDCLLPTVKHGDGSFRTWTAVSCFSAAPIVTLKGGITKKKYGEISADQAHPVTKTLFPAEDGIFQDDDAVGLTQSWFDEHRDEVKHLPLPHNHSTSTLIEQL
ncbi:DDE_3 domain-containing protein [Trichonephila clavipes]|nr:DDE_3 domain-containing protein [Trichonephila clavipes]